MRPLTAATERTPGGVKKNFRFNPQEIGGSKGPGCL